MLKAGDTDTKKLIIISNCERTLSVNNYAVVDYKDNINSVTVRVFCLHFCSGWYNVTVTSRTTYILFCYCTEPSMSRSVLSLGNRFIRQ